MLGAIKSRADNFRKGAQRSAITSWLNRAKRPPPMRSITTTQDDTITQIVEPTALKHAVDDAFERRALGGYGPSTWYKGHILEAATVEGHAARIALAEYGTPGLSEEVKRQIPRHLLPCLDLAQRKYVPAMPGGFANNEPYEDRGSMQKRTGAQWHAWWSAKKKGTAPGQSQLSVNMIWALQMAVAQDQETDKSSKTGKAGKSGVEKTCNTYHVFDALRELTNMVLVTALVPSALLRNVLVLVDKAQGLNAMSNKRPLGMLEQLAQATLGPQFRILEDVWQEYEMIDCFQSGGSRGTGCEVPLMNLTAKLEHAYLYKQFLALILQDQSKAFETLHQYLGQEIPLRRLGVPEGVLKLINAFKTGSWFMVATAWGPRESDWSRVGARMHNGTNELFALPSGPEDPPCRQIGFHDVHGATQGSAGGTSIYRSYYDWWVGFLRMSLKPKDPSPYIGALGKIRRSPGDGFVDDTGLTLTSIPGAVRALQASMIFYELQDGALNVSSVHC
jgi:hypothetical protein